MTKEEILNYKVISDSQKAKKGFNRALNRGDIVILGDFKNQYGELFVVYRSKSIALVHYITGDEFGWELEWLYVNGVISKDHFMQTLDEQKEIVKIIKTYKAKR